MDLRDVFGEGTTVNTSDVWKEYRRASGGDISGESEETESERNDSLSTSADAQTSVDLTPIESDETEPESVSDSSKETGFRLDWVENSPKWNRPTNLALRMANTPSSIEWRAACRIMDATDTHQELGNQPVPWNTDTLFTTLHIKPSRAGLRKLKHAIRQPVQPPYLREVIFDCQAIQTREDVDNLEKCRESLVEILEILYSQTGEVVQPIRDALILLLEAFLCAIDTKQEVWCCWNSGHPDVYDRTNEMTCRCRLVYTGIGACTDEVPKFEVLFDYGLDIGQWTVAESGEKTVQEIWLCAFHDECEPEFGRLMINGWPGLKQQGLDYNLVAFEAMFMTTDLRTIELRNTKVHLGGLLSLLNRNKDTLDVVILEQVDTDNDSEA